MCKGSYPSFGWNLTDFEQINSIFFLSEELRFSDVVGEVDYIFDA